MSPVQVHYRALDLFRFIAAVAVAYFHFCSFAGLPENPNLRHAVDFFFILSGFVMYHTYRELHRTDIGVFFVRRLARIYPLHLLTLVFFVAYGVLRVRMGAEPSQLYERSAIIPNLLMIHAWGTTSHGTFNGPSWSISAEWFVYLLFPVFLAMGNRPSRVRPGIVFLIMGAVIFLILIVLNQTTETRTWTLWTYDWGALRAVPSFLLGMAVRGLPLPALSWSTVYPALIAYFGLYFLPLPGEFFVVASMLVVAMTAAATGNSFLSSPRMKMFADTSYAMYMIHLCVAVILFNVVTRYFGSLKPHYMVAIALIVTFLLSLASYSLFEKPARNLIRNWIEPLVRSRDKGVNAI